jgi:predicted MFS family arabinose efflux permease
MGAVYGVAVVQSADGSLRVVWRIRGFRRFLAATTISAVGDFLSSVGVIVVIYRSTHSVGWLGAAAFLRVISWAAATAAGGVLGDRFDRRRVLVGFNALAAVAAALLALVAVIDAPVAVVIGVSMGLDFVAGLMNPTFSAAVPAVVGDGDVAGANAAVTTVEQVSLIAGPALGALLVSAFSPEVAFGCNAASFALAAWLFVRVPAGGNADDHEGEPPRFREGLAAVRSSRAIGVLVAVFVAAVFSFGFTMVLYVLVAVRRLGMDESGIGYLNMAEGLGGVLAGFVAGRAAARCSAPLLVAVVVATATVPMVLATTSVRVVALGALAVGGATYVILEVVVVTWLQQVTDDALLGRVMGLLMSFGAVGTALGALFAPPLEAAVGLSWALVVSGLVLLAAVAVLAPSLPAVALQAARRRDDLAPTVAVFRRLALFESASDLALQRLAAAVVDVELGAGVTVIREGDPPDDFYVVRLGELDVHSSGEAGDALRRVNRLGPDDWFGEIGLLTHTARTASVITASAVTLWRIPGDVFADAFESPALHSDLVRSGVVVRLARTHPSRIADLG